MMNSFNIIKDNSMVNFCGQGSINISWKILIALSIFCIGNWGIISAQQKPNIILILSDDQGYHDLGSYGSEEVKTPNLDKLASEGVRLTNFYVEPVCAPTQGMVMTGRYPRRNGTFENFRNNMVNYGHEYTPYEYSVSPEKVLGTDLREVLISEVLDQAGYYNGYFGKWDLGQLKRYLPLQQGFDDFYGFPVTGFDYFTHKRYGIHTTMDGNTPTTKDQGVYSTSLITREALQFLDNRPSDSPFFLTLTYNAPHGNSETESARKRQSEIKMDSVIRYKVPATEKFLRMYPEVGNDIQSRKRRGYMAAITQMDYNIGKIFNAIDDMGATKNTLVIFLSDNGGSGIADNSPLRGGKGDLFEGGVRVPSIIKWPEHIEKGTKNDAILSGLDIFPTIISAAGGDLPDSVVYDGFDMLPTLQDKIKSRRKNMFWVFRGDSAARVNQWKWVNSKSGSGLFNLSNDIGEKNDLSKDYPEILEMIKSEFRSWNKEIEAAEPRGPYMDY